MSESVLNYGQHKLKNKVLSVSDTTSDQTEQSTDVDADAIHVKGLPPNATEEILNLFFSNEQASGGGNVEEVKLYKDASQAVVWFTDASSEKCNNIGRGRAGEAGLFEFLIFKLSIYVSVSLYMYVMICLSFQLFNVYTHRSPLSRSTRYNQKCEHVIVESVF